MVRPLTVTIDMRGDGDPKQEVVRAWREHFVAVTACGAQGDGATDDTAAFNEAIRLAALVGGTVVVPSGTFVVDGVVVRSGVRIVGEAGAVVKLKASATGSAFVASARVGVAFEGLTVDMNGANQGNPAYPVTKRGIYAANTDRIEVRNCRFVNLFEVAVDLYQCSYIRLVDSDFEGDVEGTPAEWMVDDIHLQTCHYVTIRNNRFIHAEPADADHGVVAIFAAATDHVDIGGNKCRYCGRSVAGSHQGAAVDLYLGCAKTIIAGNDLLDCNYYGVRISRSQDIHVRGNYIHTPSNQGVQILADADYDAKRIFIVGNEIVTKQTDPGYGVYVVGNDAAGDEPQDIIVTGNRISSYAGVWVRYGGIRVTVAHNHLACVYPAVRLEKGTAAVLTDAAVIGNVIDGTPNTAAYCIAVVGARAIVSENQIVGAYQGLKLTVSAGGRCANNLIQASNYHIMLYNATQNLWLSDNMLTGAGAEYFREGTELVYYDQIDEATGIRSMGADGVQRGALRLFDGAGGNTPAYIELRSPNGTAGWLFIEDDRTVKIHTAIPTQNADGVVVGSQT